MILENYYSLRRREEKRLRKESVKNYLEEIALRLILTLGELHGYKFKKYIENRSKFEVFLSPSEVYPILWSLRDRGLISSETQKVGGRKRVVYQPVPILTRKYAELRRDVGNRVRRKINDISADYLNFQYAAPLETEVKNQRLKK